MKLLLVNLLTNTIVQNNIQCVCKFTLPQFFLDFICDLNSLRMNTAIIWKSSIVGHYQLPIVFENIVDDEYLIFI